MEKVIVFFLLALVDALLVGLVAYILVAHGANGALTLGVFVGVPVVLLGVGALVYRAWGQRS